jgi:hypothetical protein
MSDVIIEYLNKRIKEFELNKKNSNKQLSDA